MDVVCLPEFSRCLANACSGEPDDPQVRQFLGRLSVDHESKNMRAAQVRIPGTEIDLWATNGFELSQRGYRVAWRYEERGGRQVVVCFALVGLWL